MPENSSRFVYLDNIRNNLVYSVVLLHAVMIFAYPITYWWPPVDKAASSRIYETFLLVCDAFQMPSLMFIAVLFIFPSLQNTTVPGYLKKRFFRLMVPVLIFSVCGADINYPLRYK